MNDCNNIDWDSVMVSKTYFSNKRISLINYKLKKELFIERINKSDYSINVKIILIKYFLDRYK